MNQFNKHILDWVVTPDISLISNLQVMDKCISNHKVIVFDLPFCKPKPVKRTITCRNKNIDNQKLGTAIQGVAEEMKKDYNKNLVDIYNRKLKELLDIYAPLKTRIVTDRPSVPWMTSHIKNLKTERRRAERKWHSTSLCVHRDIYRDLNRKLKNAIETAKKYYYCHKIEECLTSKALYNVANTLSGKGGNSQGSIPKTIPADKLAERFGNFFIEKIAKIRKPMDAASSSLPSFDCFDGDCMMMFEPVTKEDVMKIIKASPPKSCCLDPIPTPLLVIHLEHLIEPITAMINQSLLSGIVPVSFKHAVVLPLLKKPNLSPEELSNFRPVSNLPFLSKILEKVVLLQLKKHLTKNNLLDNFQSACREFHNTETALLKVQNDLICAADKGHTSILALLDLSAAFDTIDHSILLERLSKTFGLSGVVLKWFSSYVSGRTQFIMINNQTSPVFDLNYGVPQGSVLGPVLYTIYTKPLGTLIQSFDLCYHMYADDTQVYSSSRPENFTTLVKKFESCISHVKNWMIVNKLKMNEDKTELLACSIDRKASPYVVDHMYIDSDQILLSSKAKNLGVYFDSKLSMTPHISHLAQIMLLELRRIKQIRSFLNEGAVKTLVSSFILSRLDYCNSLLYGLPMDTLKRLQLIQNNAARLILKKRKRDHLTPMFRHLHWLPVQTRIKYKIAVLCFKCVHGYAPNYLVDLVGMYVPTRSLRSGNKALLSVPCKPSRKDGHRAFAQCAPVVWNALPLSIREASSISQFKTLLKTHLFTAHEYLN